MLLLDILSIKKTLEVMSFCKGILKLSNDVILNNKKLYTNFELTFEIQPLGAIFSKLRLYRFGTDILVPLRFYADV